MLFNKVEHISLLMPSQLLFVFGCPNYTFRNAPCQAEGKSFDTEIRSVTIHLLATKALIGFCPQGTSGNNVE